MPNLHWYQDESLFSASNNEYHFESSVRSSLEQARIVLLKDGLYFYKFATVDHMKAAAFIANEEMISSSENVFGSDFSIFSSAYQFQPTNTYHGL